ncbi:hypothetical protein [Bacillus piscicola]|nr:hypothetical protein [Bacillus piscicola]
MAKLCEICGHKEVKEQEEEEEKGYNILGICQNCMEDRSQKQ